MSLLSPIPSYSITNISFPGQKMLNGVTHELRHDKEREKEIKRAKEREIRGFVSKKEQILHGPKR